MWKAVGGLNTKVNLLQGLADQVLTGPVSNPSLGSSTNPTVSVINGNLSLSGNSGGAGLLDSLGTAENMPPSRIRDGVTLSRDRVKKGSCSWATSSGQASPIPRVPWAIGNVRCGGCSGLLGCRTGTRTDSATHSQLNCCWQDTAGARIHSARSTKREDYQKHYSPWVAARQEQLEQDVRRTWNTDRLACGEAKGVRGTRQSRASQLIEKQREKMVEAAGVEPASENVTGQETTCLVAFPLPDFAGNFRLSRSERTRNAND
jgi:hypothetical protein